MKTTPILITGGAGFIGSQVAKCLRKSGFTPIVLDNLSGGYAEFVKWGPFIQASIDDQTTVRSLFETYKPEAILHFAAYINVGESVQNPKKYYENNVAATLRFLKIALDYGIQKIVFSSTAAVYGNPSTIPIPEELPCDPLNPYGTGKWMVEKALSDFNTAEGLKSLSLRYFNAAGSDPEGEIGEAHVPETHLIPLALDVAMGRIPRLTLFGTDYPTPDGTCVRDYIHVLDLAEAHQLALQYLLDGGVTETLNLGNGTGFSVKEVIQKTEAITGALLPYKEGSRRSGDPAILIASSKKASQLLRWKPRYPELESIIQHAWNWRKRGFKRLLSH